MTTKATKKTAAAVGDSNIYANLPDYSISQLDKSDHKETVLIIGASFGGLGTARQLIKNGGADKFQVIMVDSKDYFTMGGMWQFVWSHRLKMDQVKWPLRNAQLKGIDLRTKTTVAHWDPENKMVTLHDDSTIEYDHIVLACGVVPDPETIPGIQKHVNICNQATVMRQKMEIHRLLIKAKKEPVTFVLAISVSPYKCPPAPFELAFIVDEALRKANVRENARVVVSCPVDWPMPPVAKGPFTKEMSERNIEFLHDHPIDKVEGHTIHYNNGTTIDTTLIWAVWPLRAPKFVQDAIPTNDKGFVTVQDKVTNTIPGVENAHVIGDCCTVPFGNHLALPKAGEFAWHMGVSVADALMDKVEPADRTGNCVAETGFGKGILLQPDFSDVCNDPKRGKPKMQVEAVETGSADKVEWANGYLKEIFGGWAKPLDV